MGFLGKNKLLIVDVSSLIHKAINIAAYNFNSQTGYFNGGTFGVLNQVNAACEELRPGHILFCYDHKPYFRLEEVPFFKNDRVSSDEVRMKARKTHDLFQQFSSNFPSWDIKGFEADDLIAYAFNKYCRIFNSIIIFSSDSDLWQLFNAYHHKLAFYHGKNKKLFTYDDFKAKTTFSEGWQYLVYDSIIGGHNGLHKGIPGYGPVKARDLVHNLKATNLFGAIAKLPIKVTENIKLMKLPHYSIYDYKDSLTLPEVLLTRDELLKWLFSKDLKLQNNSFECIKHIAKGVSYL